MGDYRIDTTTRVFALEFLQVWPQDRSQIRYLGQPLGCCVFTVPTFVSSRMISISAEFSEFIPAAILRLKYLHPKVEFEPTPDGIAAVSVEKIDIAQLSREVVYQVYREKIYQETLTMRQSLYQMLAI